MVFDQIEFSRKRLGTKLAQLSRSWRRALDSALSDLGLTDATWAPLLHLDEHGEGITQKELASRVGIDASTLVRLLDILCEREFIERTADAADRRARKVFLTQAGRDAVFSLQQARNAVDARILADIGDEEVVHLTEAFKKIDGRLQELQSSAAARKQ